MRIIEILSSLVFRTVPTFVLAANALTDPNDFCDTLLVWKKGRSTDGGGCFATIFAMFYFTKSGWLPSASSSRLSKASIVLERFFFLGSAIVFMMNCNAALPTSR